MLVVIAAFRINQSEFGHRAFHCSQRGFAGARCARYPRPSRRAALNYVLLHFRCNAAGWHAEINGQTRQGL